MANATSTPPCSAPTRCGESLLPPPSSHSRGETSWRSMSSTARRGSYTSMPATLGGGDSVPSSTSSTAAGSSPTVSRAERRAITEPGNSSRRVRVIRSCTSAGSSPRSTSSSQGTDTNPTAWRTNVRTTRWSPQSRSTVATRCRSRKPTGHPRGMAHERSASATLRSASVPRRSFSESDIVTTTWRHRTQGPIPNLQLSRISSTRSISAAVL